MDGIGNMEGNSVNNGNLPLLLFGKWLFLGYGNVFISALMQKIMIKRGSQNLHRSKGRQQGV